MSARWFRLYAEVVNDPKVQLLPCEDFRAWVNLLCLASENDGRLPSFEAISFALRVDVTVAERVVERLSNAGLIDRLNGGPNGYHYAPHGWSKRQYKSDTSTERVKRFRERSGTVSVTPPETEADTETELKKEKTTSSPKKGERLAPDWRPSDADLTFALHQGMTNEETRREADRFRDFWIAKPGSGGVKLDWPATWRNWCRNRRGEPTVSDRKETGRGRSGDTSFADIAARRARERERGVEVSPGQAAVSGRDLGWAGGAIEGQPCFGD